MTTKDHLTEQPDAGLEKKPRWHPNRIAVYLEAGAALGVALAVPLADMDTTSAAGIIAGLAAITAVVHKWLDGWQKHEDRTEKPPL